MGAAEFARLVVEVCSLSLPPGITTERLYSIAQVESGANVQAVSPPNRDGSRDYGLMQLNGQWIGQRGFPATVAEAMEPCANLAAGIRILADADRQAACIYNTGRPNCRNGYPEKIQAAAGQIAQRVARLTPALQQIAPSQSAAPAAPAVATEPPPSTELTYGRTAPGRTLTYGRR